ncbi:hypothetical protein ACHAXA_000274 [Cyclostephanos tholiformis]|uniref:RING-type domain-containing protein n=1 Tax=Cyclostephanos tholiformis TaxID=382380 RepID=A0ABD3SBB3_9STRA
MLPNCHICDFIGSSLIPVAFYLLACASCGLPFLCLWCAFRWNPWEVTNRGSFRSEDVTRRDSTTDTSDRLDDTGRARIASRIVRLDDDIGRAQIVSSSLVTARVAIRRIYSLDSTVPSSDDSPSSRAASPVIAYDDEQGLGSSVGTIDAYADSRLVMDSTGWEVDMCAICTEQYDEDDLVSYSRERRCKHNFHPKCIERWLKVRNDCPCCRSRYIR